MDRTVRMSSCFAVAVLFLSSASQLNAAPTPATQKASDQSKPSEKATSKVEASMKVEASAKVEASPMPTDMLRGKAVVDVSTSTMPVTDQASMQLKSKAVKANAKANAKAPSNVKTPSKAAGGGGSRQWSGKATPADLKSSTSRINMFLAVLKGKGKYNSFMTQLNNTGLISSLANLLPFFGITVMVPTDQAWAKITPAQWKQINSKPQGVLQLVAFHCFFPAFSGTDLTNMAPGTEISTADYPQRGNRAWKLKTTTAMFNGKKGDQVGSYLNDNSIYYDYFGKNLLIAHGISSVMMPAQFYDP